MISSAINKSNSSGDMSNSQVSVHISGFPPRLTICDIYPFAYIISDGINFTIAKDSENNFLGFILVHFRSHNKAKEFVSKELYYKRGLLLECKIVFDHDEYIKQTLTALRKPKQIFVNKLPRNMKKEDLEQAFSSYGQIEEISMVKKDKSNKYAFIDFKKSSSARNAINKGRVEIKDELFVSVYYAKPRIPKSFVNKIHPKLAEYINAITKEHKTYDPKQYIMLHDYVLGIYSKASAKYKKIMEAKGVDDAPVLELISKRKHGNSAKKELFDSSSESQDEPDSETFVLDQTLREVGFSLKSDAELKASFLEKNDSINVLGNVSFLNTSKILNTSKLLNTSKHQPDKDLLAEGENQQVTNDNLCKKDSHDKINCNKSSFFNEQAQQTAIQNQQNLSTSNQWNYYDGYYADRVNNAYNQDFNYNQGNNSYPYHYPEYEQNDYQNNEGYEFNDYHAQNNQYNVNSYNNSYAGNNFGYTNNGYETYDQQNNGYNNYSTSNYEQPNSYTNQNYYNSSQNPDFYASENQGHQNTIEYNQMYPIDQATTRQNSYQAPYQCQNNTLIQNSNGYYDNKLDTDQHLLPQPQADSNQNFEPITSITEQDPSKKNIDKNQDICNNNKQNVTNVLTVLNTSGPRISNNI